MCVSSHAGPSPEYAAVALSRDRMIADTEEMAAWVRKELGKDKIFVLGHSFGSFLGLQLAERHPEWLYAYIGACQLIDGPESERRGWGFAMDAARRAGNAEAVRELQAIARYGAPGRIIPIKDIYVERKWVSYYGGVMAYRRENSADSALAQLPQITATRKFAGFGKAMSSQLPICSPRWLRSI
jgi:pimeloyl-ACP methyl ester carboxylesterase